MDTQEEIRNLRSALTPAMHAFGDRSDGLSDEQFTGRLRRYLMSLTGGESAAGFECASTKTASGDFLATLVWSEDAMRLHPKFTSAFSAYGENENLAFLRAAHKALLHPEYRDLPFRGQRT
jgi:hypothetical protein